MSSALNSHEGDSSLLWPQGLSSLAFDNNFFLRPDFSVELFLSTYAASNSNRSISLETLRDDLVTYDQLLAGTLIQLVDRDYSDFLQVSSNLHGLDDHVDRVNNIMKSFAATVDTCRTHFSSQLDRINSMETRLRDMRKTKLHAQNTKRCLKLAHLVFSSSSNDDDNESRFLRTRTVARFKKLSHNLPVSALSEHAQRKMQDCERRLCDHYHSALVQALQRNDAVQFAEALEALQTLDQVHLLADSLRTGFLLPLFETPFAQVAASSSCTDAFACLFQTIETGIFENKCFADVVHKSSADGGDNSEHSDDEHSAHAEVLFHVILPSALALITNRCPSLFKVTSAPDHFLDSYAEGQKFLTAIESHIHNVGFRKAFREHPSCRQFLQAWNVPVFFQLCVQRMVAQLEAVLRLPVQLTTTSSTPEKYSILQLRQIYLLIRECWSPPDAAVYAIRQLIPRFWRLTLQFLSRLNVWLNSESLNSSLNGDIVDPVENVPSRAAPGSNFSSNFEGKITLFIALVCDMCQFQRFLFDDFPVLLRSVLNSKRKAHSVENIDDSSGVIDEAAFTESLAVARDTLAATTQKCANEFALNFSKILCAAVGSVHETPRLYRKTNRDLNWKPSAYIERINKVLLLCKPLTQQNPEVASDFLSAVLQPVFAEYAKQIQVTLDAVRKTEESLRRLRMVRSGQVANTLVVVENGNGTASIAAADGAAGGDHTSDSPFDSGKSPNRQQQKTGNMSDDDKIRTKIYIDLKALRQCVENELFMRRPALVDKKFVELEEHLQQQVQAFME